MLLGLISDDGTGTIEKAEKATKTTKKAKKEVIKNKFTNRCDL
jgi:hypothetical protein